MAMMPATTQYALEARASKSAKTSDLRHYDPPSLQSSTTSVSDLEQFVLAEPVALTGLFLFGRTDPTGRSCSELIHPARCWIGTAVCLL